MNSILVMALNKARIKGQNDLESGTLPLLGVFSSMAVYAWRISELSSLTIKAVLVFP